MVTVNQEIGKRKARSDKKHEVKPTITIQLKEAISRLSYISNTPIKNVAEQICLKGIITPEVLEHLALSFRRDLKLGNTFFIGDLCRISLQKKTVSSQNERIGIRFKQHDYENLTALAYALDVTPSRATALLLEVSIKKSDFINDFFHNYLITQLDGNRMKELKKVMKFINANNPYEEEISWGVMLSVIYDEMKVGTKNVPEAINRFINYWRK